MFAGSGSVGVESYINKRNSILLELSPLTKPLIETKLFLSDLDEIIFDKELKAILDISDNNKFIPKWQNINTFYNPEILDYLSSIWYNIHNKNLFYKNIIKFSFLFISKAFSYADDNVPKLFCSKIKKEKMNKILNKDWKELIEIKFRKKAYEYFNALKELKVYLPEKLINTKIDVYDDTDSYEFNIENSDIKAVDIIITSPPYMQAQEYIRSIKLDLYWLGYNDEKVKQLTSKEIPYRQVDLNNQFNNNLYNKIKAILNYENLIKNDKKIFSSYFYYTIKSIEKYALRLKKDGHLCIFVGNPVQRGVTIPIWEIIMDYFISTGNFSLVEILADKIISRRLASKRKNENPEGMKYEYLLILKRK